MRVARPGTRDRKCNSSDLFHGNLEPQKRTASITYGSVSGWGAEGSQREDTEEEI